MLRHQIPAIALFLAILISSVSRADDRATEALSLPFLGSPKHLSMTDIKGWVSDDHNPVTSVEQFIDRLPDLQKSGRTLMYKSRSLQNATPHNPRIIFFGSDARLIIAISTDKNDKMYNVVEVIEYDESNARFDFFTVDFNSHSKDEVITKNPKICSSCHRQDKRPNWESYSAWPGAYGSFHDRIHSGSRENQLYREFIVRTPNDPRLSSLGFTETEKYRNGTGTLYAVSTGGGSNAVLGVYISALNFHRVAHRITDEKHNDRYRHAVLAALIKCKDPIEDFIPEDLKSDHPKDYRDLLEETKRSIEKLYWRNAKTAFDFQEFKSKDIKEFAYWQGEADRGDLLEDNIKRVSDLRYVLEQRKTNPMPMSQWSTNFGAYGKYNYNDGFGGLNNLLFMYGKLALTEKERELVEWQPQFLMISSSSKNGVYDVRYNNSSEVCSELKKLVQ